MVVINIVAWLILLSREGITMLSSGAHSSPAPVTFTVPLIRRWTNRRGIPATSVNTKFLPCKYSFLYFFYGSTTNEDESGIAGLDET